MDKVNVLIMQKLDHTNPLQCMQAMADGDTTSVRNEDALRSLAIAGTPTEVAR